MSCFQLFPKKVLVVFSDKSVIFSYFFDLVFAFLRWDSSSFMVLSAQKTRLFRFFFAAPARLCPKHQSRVKLETTPNQRKKPKRWISSRKKHVSFRPFLPTPNTLAQTNVGFCSKYKENLCCISVKITPLVQWENNFEIVCQNCNSVMAILCKKLIEF